jgi:hypothetical protein
MIWIYIGGSLLSLFILWVLGATLRDYARFRRSASKLWRDDVLRLEAAARRRVAGERLQLLRCGGADAAQEQALS